MGAFLLSSVLIATVPFEYIDGIGRVPNKVVAHCLVRVGVPEVDYLYDGKWEEFSDCVNSMVRKRR
jgi:hypothetical protein